MRDIISFRSALPRFIQSSSLPVEVHLAAGPWSAHMPTTSAIDVLRSLIVSGTCDASCPKGQFGLQLVDNQRLRVSSRTGSMTIPVSVSEHSHPPPNTSEVTVSASAGPYNVVIRLHPDCFVTCNACVCTVQVNGRQMKMPCVIPVDYIPFFGNIGVYADPNSVWKVLFSDLDKSAEVRLRGAVKELRKSVYVNGNPPPPRKQRLIDSNWPSREAELLSALGLGRGARYSGTSPVRRQPNFEALDFSDVSSDVDEVVESKVGSPGGGNARKKRLNFGKKKVSVEDDGGANDEMIVGEVSDGELGLVSNRLGGLIIGPTLSPDQRRSTVRPGYSTSPSVTSDGYMSTPGSTGGEISLSPPGVANQGTSTTQPLEGASSSGAVLWNPGGAPTTPSTAAVRAAGGAYVATRASEPFSEPFSANALRRQTPRD